MVLEVVEIRIRAEDSAKFEMAITEALTTITARAQGMVKYRLIRGLETPSRYLMEIVWNGLEDHSQYRASEPRQRWLELVSPYFDGSPFMEHFELLVSGAEAPN